jgi:hypothetical protein
MREQAAVDGKKGGVRYMPAIFRPDKMQIRVSIDHFKMPVAGPFLNR